MSFTPKLDGIKRVETKAHNSRQNIAINILVGSIKLTVYLCGHGLNKRHIGIAGFLCDFSPRRFFGSFIALDTTHDKSMPWQLIPLERQVLAICRVFDNTHYDISISVLFAFLRGIFLIIEAFGDDLYNR